MGMFRLRKSALFLCLSAMLLALGTYLSTIETPVWTGGETDLMHVYTFFFSFPLWISAGVLLILGIKSGLHKPPAAAQPRKPFLNVELFVAMALGGLILVSVFLPWVNAKTINPTFERPGFGPFSVEPYPVLSGISLISNYWKGDVMNLLFVGGAIALLYVPLLALVEKRSAGSLRAVLLLLSGACVMFPVGTVWATERWAVPVAFGEGGGAFGAIFESSGVGLLIASASAVGLVVLGVFVGFRSVRSRYDPVDLQTRGFLGNSV